MRVMEVAMEIALPPPVLEAIFKRHGYRPTRDAAMSTSVGGIGPLLRERIIAHGEENIETIGVTPLYQHTWIQSWFEWGQLHLEKRRVGMVLQQFLQDTSIDLSLTLFDGSVVKIHVWEAAYGKSKVYFLDCPEVIDVVYPSDEDAPLKHPNPAAWAHAARQKHSWLVGRGALLLAKALKFQPDITVLSETPTLFGHHKLAKDELQNDPFFASTRYIFNDHTPMEYAHPVWNKDMINTLKVDTSSYSWLPGNADLGEVDVTRLLIGICEGVFGVAQKHGRIMRAMPSLKDYAPKIEAVTNGIHVGIWQSPDYKDISQWTDADLLKLKKRKKDELLDWVWRQYGLWHTWKEQVQDKGVILWTRRITGYKRVDLLDTLCKDVSLRKQFLDLNLVLLVGVRIHQHDDQAQTMIYNLLDIISQDRRLQERIVFLDNFNVWMAPKLFQGTDAAIMLADDGREASATGFMKAQVNGGLIIASEDGAIPESVVFQGREKDGQTANGFEVPYVQGLPRADNLLRACKQFHQVLKNDALHAAMVRSAFSAVSQVNVVRTVQETRKIYDRLLSAQTPATTAISS